MGIASRGRIWPLALLLAALACCGRQGGPAPDAAPPAQAGDTGYLSPPEVSGVAAGPNGTVVLSGAAPPDSLIRLSAPDGSAFGAATAADGTWRLELPPAAGARMFAMAAEAGARRIPAQGALLVAPGPQPEALLVRAGQAAVPAGTPGAGPSIASVDYDPSGYAAVGGLAPPHTMVRLMIDGTASGAAQTDARGRYAMLAPNHPLSFGRHVIAVETASTRAQAEVELTQPGPMTSPYQASREPDGWRVEWALPGGGVQTTLALVPPARAT